MFGASCGGWKAVRQADIDIDQSEKGLGNEETAQEKFALVKVEGHYVHGFETSYFKACGSKEEWWVDDGVLAERYRDTVQGKGYGRARVFVRLSGMLSDLTGHGPMGSSRCLRITQIYEIRLSREDDCKWPVGSSI
jgi:hypothetical protein